MEIEALKYNQKDKDIYVFTADPNYIKKLVSIKDISESDDNFQRPYDIKRIEEIRLYILGRDKLYKKGKDIYAQGYIPNAIVLNLSNRYKVSSKSGRTFISFPDLKNISKFKDSIEIIDGQHRLLAFDDNTKNELLEFDYEMCFVAFIDLQKKEKKEIFMVLNERQKTVDKNILLRHKKLLNLLLTEDESRYEVIIKLNNEEDSPLYDRIIMAGEKKRQAFKAVQLEEVFNSSKALENIINSKGELDNKRYQIFKNYLIAWSEVFDKAWFKKSNTLTKISGIRFICTLFPYIYDIISIIHNRKNYTKKAFSEIIQKIRDDEFNDRFDLNEADKFQFFQDRTSIIKLANKIGKETKDHYIEKTEDFLV